MADERIPNETVRHIAIVMGNAINGILLERLLEEQEKRNKITQRWFMILALVATIATIVQVVIGIVLR